MNWPHRLIRRINNPFWIGKKGRSIIVDSVGGRRYVRNMSQVKDIDNLRQAIATLTALTPKDREEEDRIYQAVGLVHRFLANRESLASLQAEPPKSPETPAGDAGDIPAGFTFIEAGIAVLEASDQVPLAVPEMIERMEARNYEVTAQHARSALTGAFKRRALSQQDVVPVTHDTWGLSKWYSEKKLASLRHADLTRKSIESRKARGEPFGATLRFSEKDAVEFKRLLGKGYSLTALAKHFCVSYGTVQNYRRRLEDWSPGDPYPPKRKKKEDTDTEEASSGHLKVVK